MSFSEQPATTQMQTVHKSTKVRVVLSFETLACKSIVDSLKAARSYKAMKRDVQTPKLTSIIVGRGDPYTDFYHKMAF
jgi:hypothetical protein